MKKGEKVNEVIKQNKLSFYVAETNTRSKTEGTGSKGISFPTGENKAEIGDFITSMLSLG